MLSFVVSAYAFEIDGISYRVTQQPNGESSGEVEVMGGEIKEVIEIPETVTYDGVTYTVTSIGSQAFYGRSNSGNFTRKYIIPGTVKSIKRQAFYDNYYLEEVEFNEGLQTIGDDAFGYNFQLKEIRIPSTVTSIEAQAFRTNQQNRATISCLAETPPSIQSSTFSGRTDATLHVVVSDVEAYKEAQYWKGFSEITGDILFRDRCYAPVITCDNDLLTMSCATEGATIYYTTDGSKPDENAFRYTYPISYNANQIIRAIAVAEGYENSSIRNFYDKDYFESITNVIDEQGLYYTLKQTDNGFCYSVTGHSDEMDAEIVIPTELNGLPVRTIGENVFEGCSSLLSVVIPKSVTSIGFAAFEGCTSLSSVTIPNSVTTIDGSVFYGCSGLTSVKLGKNVRSIGDSAFSNCTRLTSITLPNALESIGGSAFSGCSGMTSVTLSSSITILNSSTFQGCSSLTTITIPDGVTRIEDGYYYEGYRNGSRYWIEQGVFCGCRNLTSVIIGTGVTYIGSYAFRNCEKLSSIKMGENVNSIGDGAFSNCSNLTSITLPNTLENIGENAFPSSMTSIELPNSITVIPENQFSNNYYLKYIKLGNNVKSIGKNAFGSSEPVIVIDTPTPPTIASDAFPNVQYLADLNVIVPDAKAETAYRKAAVWQEMTFSNQNNVSEVTVGTPGDLSFELITQCNMQPAKVVGMKVNGTINADDFNQMLVNMKSLLRLDLSDCDITAIPDNAMKGKMQLKELILPTKLQTIGQSAFQGCTFLSKLTMQNGLQTIGKNAFQGCSGLTGELNLPTTLTSIGESAFVGTSYTSVKLPSTLKTIGDYAFNNVPIKQQLTLPKKVTSVGSSAFAGTKITGLEIPDGVTSIGDNAFADTPIEGHVTIPDGVTYLGKGAFRNSQLSTVFLPNSVAELSQGVFQGCPNLDLVYVPDNYTGLSSSVFDGCGALQILRLSANLTSMGSYSLQNTSLEYIKVPSQVEVLSQGVLKNCKNLESLSLPSSLKTVEGEALYGCTALRNLSIEALEPPVIRDKSAIRGINTDLCLISIPTQSYRKYVLAEYWGQFVQMRNDIAVETSGNGEIAFESVNDDEEEDEEDEVSETREFDLGTGAARVRRRVAELATEDEESMAIANNGSTIYVPQQGKVRFYIIPAEGEELISATLDGEDIMPYIVDGVYTATADKRNAKLVVVFSGDGQGGGAGLMGDVNGDGTVSVTDVGCVINFILEQVPEPFITAAADMNSDGSISVTDVGYIINYILNDGAACRAEQMATYIYDVPMLMPNANGYVLTLDGADAFIGFQMDIFVPEYANGCSVQLKNTGTSHQLACRQLSRGHYRVVCYSPVNETFPKGLTDLLTFATESDMSISDIRFTTEGLDEVRFDDMNATPTSIASVTDLKAADIRVHTLDGQLCRIVRAKSGENPLKDLQPGIYLINDRKYIVR